MHFTQFKIKKVELAGGYTIPKESIARKVHFLCKRVRGDFRQQAILDSWENIALKQFPIIRATISVGAGTYIRSIAHMVGESTGVQICLSALSRTRIYNDTISLTKGKGQPND
jgi:tRNA U55 pseudouridine synthase TruB